MLVESLDALSPSVRAALQRGGFIHVSQLLTVPPTELSMACKMTTSEAVATMEAARAQTNSSTAAPRPIAVTALEMWHHEEDQRQINRSIPTFCKELDELLGGGISLGSLTEVCGPPGVGKTQLCCQLAVAVQLPERFGGHSARCLFIDTEGSFFPGRFREMAQAAVSHVQQVAHQQCSTAVAPLHELQELRLSLASFTVQSILDSTLYLRLHSLAEVVALINLLPTLVEQQEGNKAPSSKINLIIFDSIAFHFRCLSDNALRSRLVFQVGQQLQDVATQLGVAIVVSNQMTTRIDHHSGDPASLIPALGDAWGHIVSSRLVLTCGPSGSRIAGLEKSPNRPRGECAFRITRRGIRSVPPPSTAAAGNTVEA